MDSEKPQRRAAEICSDLELEDAARGALRPEMTPTEFLQVLRAGGHHFDAVKFLARALPKRRAVLWALACVRPSIENDADPGDVACLEAAELWAEQPDADGRTAALGAAEARNFEGPCALVAAAAGWSGGSLAPPGLPEMPPGEHDTAHAAASAIGVVAATPPEQCEQRQREFLERGLQLSEDLDLDCDGDVAPA